MTALVKALRINSQQVDILLLHFDLESDETTAEAKHLALAVEGVGNMGGARREAVEALYSQVTTHLLPPLPLASLHPSSPPHHRQQPPLSTLPSFLLILPFFLLILPFLSVLLTLPSYPSFLQVCAAEAALQAANTSSLANASHATQSKVVVPSVGLLRELLTDSTPQTPMLDGLKEEWCQMVELALRGALNGNNGNSPKKGARGHSKASSSVGSAGGAGHIKPRLMFHLWMCYWSIWSDATTEDADFFATVKVVAGEARSRSLFATPEYATVVGGGGGGSVTQSLRQAGDFMPSLSPQRYPSGAKPGRTEKQVFVTQLLEDLEQGSHSQRGVGGDPSVALTGHSMRGGSGDVSASGGGGGGRAGGGRAGAGKGWDQASAEQMHQQALEEGSQIQFRLQEETDLLVDIEGQLVPFLASLLDCKCACLSSLFLGIESKIWPKVVSLLHKLEWLWVDHNSLHHLPSAITQLENLQFLDVSSNALSKFPPSIRRLQKLHTLRAGGNFFHSVPDEICDLAALRELVLTSNKLRNLPQRLSRCSELRVLLLDNNDLSGPCPTVISSFRMLHKLSYNNNKITTLPKDMGRCLKELRVLEAHSNSISALPPSLGNLDNLAVLLLHRNRIGPRIPEFVMSPGVGLQHVTLHCNLLEEVPSDMFELPRLAVLSVHSNRLKRLPNSLSQARSLKELDAHSNHLTHKGFPSLLPKSLTTLSLHANKLQEVPKAVLMVPFCVHDTGSENEASHTLEVLRLQRNGIMKIPNNIGTVQSLHSLNLSRNKIQKVPTSLGELPLLTELYLEGNPLADPLGDIVRTGRYRNQAEMNLDNAIEKLMGGMTSESVMNEVAKLKDPPNLSKGA
jgi:Leucine-rich repeat (LRR) protein